MLLLRQLADFQQSQSGHTVTPEQDREQVKEAEQPEGEKTIGLVNMHLVYYLVLCNCQKVSMHLRVKRHQSSSWYIF